MRRYWRGTEPPSWKRWPNYRSIKEKAARERGKRKEKEERDRGKRKEKEERGKRGRITVHLLVGWE